MGKMDWRLSAVRWHCACVYVDYNPLILPKLCYRSHDTVQFTNWICVLLCTNTFLSALCSISLNEETHCVRQPSMIPWKTQKFYHIYHAYHMNIGARITSDRWNGSRTKINFGILLSPTIWNQYLHNFKITQGNPMATNLISSHSTPIGGASCAVGLFGFIYTNEIVIGFHHTIN